MFFSRQRDNTCEVAGGSVKVGDPEYGHEIFEVMPTVSPKREKTQMHRSTDAQMHSKVGTAYLALGGNGVA